MDVYTEVLEEFEESRRWAKLARKTVVFLAKESPTVKLGRQGSKRARILCEIKEPECWFLLSQSGEM